MLVDVEGGRYPANVRGRNGPRVQVSFTRGGQTFTRWVDAVDVHPADGVIDLTADRTADLTAGLTADEAAAS